MMRRFNPTRVGDFLDHILEAIERIESYIENVDEVGFAKNQMIQDAVVRNFEIMA